MAKWVRKFTLKRHFWKGLGLFDKKEDWSARHKYYYNRSLQRYLKDPEQNLLWEDMKNAIYTGELGVCEGVTIYKTARGK